MTSNDLAATHALSFVTPRPWTAAEFEDLLAQPHTTLLGDEKAFLLARTILDETEILTLATHPAYRKEGRAWALLQALQADGANRIFLEVAADNEAAQALYRKAGYHAEGRRKGYYRKPDGTRLDAIVMARSPTK